MLQTIIIYKMLQIINQSHKIKDLPIKKKHKKTLKLCSNKQYLPA